MPQPSTRVLLISPRFNPNSFWSLQSAIELVGARSLAPPLGLITVAAMLPKDWQIKLIDRNAEELHESDILAADVVMTGGMLPQEPDTLHVIAMCQRLDIPVWVGGPAPTSTPDVYDHADVLVVGEAESVIADVVAAWEAGERKARFTAPKFKADVTTTPIPRFDLLTFKHYAWVNVQFSRGCPFTCEFCDIIELYGRAPRTKTIPQMLAELDRLYGMGFRGHVDFVDDNLIGNKKAIKLFLPKLIEWREAHRYPFQLTTEASLNLSDDQDLLDMMARANFFALFTGIETPDEAALMQMTKKQNTRRSISDSVHRIYASGIWVVAGFIVGFDAESSSVAQTMHRCIRDTAVPTAIISMLTALPNTQLSRRLAKENRLFDAFREAMTQSAEMCSAGLNFVTLRPRRDIMQDCRDVIATAYDPLEFFRRVRTLGTLLKPVKQSKRKVYAKHMLLAAEAFARLSWIMTWKHPEIRFQYWFTIYHCLRDNPRSIQAVVCNLFHYIHLYPFARDFVANMDRQIAELDAGQWRDLDVKRIETGSPLEPLAAVA